MLMLILLNAKEELILLKFVIAVKLDYELTMFVLMNVISEVIYKAHCDIIDEFKNVTSELL